MSRLIRSVWDSPEEGGQLVEWGLPIVDIDFADYAAQSLLGGTVVVGPWTNGHRTQADAFAFDGSTGLVMQPKNGSNWTDSASWTAPYVSAPIATLLGFTPERTDWLSIAVEFDLDSAAPFGGGEVADMQLNYGSSHTGLQNYRTEVRNALTTQHIGVAARTWAGAQSSVSNSGLASFGRVLELQIRGGLVVPFRGTVFPAFPGAGLTELEGLGGNRGRYEMERRQPGDAWQYDPAGDVVALSMYNFNGSARTITWKRLAVWWLDLSAL